MDVIAGSRHGPLWSDRSVSDRARPSCVRSPEAAVSFPPGQQHSRARGCVLGRARRWEGGSGFQMWGFPVAPASPPCLFPEGVGKVLEAPVGPRGAQHKGNGPGF